MTDPNASFTLRLSTIAALATAALLTLPAAAASASLPSDGTPASQDTCTGYFDITCRHEHDNGHVSNCLTYHDLGGQHLLYDDCFHSEPIAGSSGPASVASILAPS